MPCGVILAAGEGRRIRTLTEKPKGLLQVGGETLVGRQVRLLEAAGVHPVILVTGYRQEDYRRLFPHLEMVANPFYAHTNTLFSLVLALLRLQQQDDIVLINGDTLFPDSLLQQMLALCQPAVAVQGLAQPTEEEVKAVLTGDRVVNLGKGYTSRYEAIGVNYFTGELCRLILDHVKNCKNPFHLYFEDALDPLLDKVIVKACFTSGCVEIDTPDDYWEGVRLYGS